MGLSDNRGGANRGQGRKPLSTAEKTKSITITLPISYIEYLRSIGRGNVSRAIRIIIQETQPRQN